MPQPNSHKETFKHKYTKLYGGQVQKDKSGRSNTQHLPFVYKTKQNMPCASIFHPMADADIPLSLPFSFSHR